MRTSTFFSSSMLAIAASAAPIDLPVVGSVDGLVKDLPVVGGVVGGLNLPVKRDLPVVGGLVNTVEGVVDNVPVVGGLVGGLNLPVKRDIDQTLPVVGGAKVPLNAGDIEVGTVDEYIKQLLQGIEVENLKVTRDIEQTLPVVGGAKVPLDAGKLTVGSLDKDVLSVVNGIKIGRDVKQTLPVVGGATVPLDAGKIQVGTVDKDALAAVGGVALNDKPVLDVVKGTTVKNLPNLGSRQVGQTLPVVGNVNVPLDAGKITVGTADKDAVTAVEGISL